MCNVYYGKLGGKDRINQMLKTSLEDSAQLHLNKVEGKMTPLSCPLT